jgi:transcriptional regulator EpsA
MFNFDQLTDGERDQFMELIQESLWIKSHFELFLWLQGRVQQHLPHDILIAAWGDFSIGLIYFDAISAVPGIRTDKIDSENLTRFLKRLFAHWESKGGTPAMLTMEECMNLDGGVNCDEVARDFSNMNNVLVHAIKDFRGRHDCLYVLLSTKKSDTNRLCMMFEALLPYIDTSLRKVPHLPRQVPKAVLPSITPQPQPDNFTGITPREAEIISLVRIGKTNIEIGTILDISAFTVKNHLQRIFKKLNVGSRTQAVAKYSESVTVDQQRSATTGR